MATYEQADFEQVANAIGVDIGQIAKHENLFEAAALWYRLNRRRPTRITPSNLLRKLDRVEKNARRLLKNLGVNDPGDATDGPEWPEVDREAFHAAYEPGDIFDGTAGPGAHLSEATRGMIEFAYRRWLGFLKANHPDDFSMPPAERITRERVRAFIDYLRVTMKPNSVAITVQRPKSSD